MNKSETIQWQSKSLSRTSDQSDVVIENSKLSSRFISGVAFKRRLFIMRLSLLGIIIKTYRNPLRWFMALQFLIRLRKRFLGDYNLKKMGIGWMCKR